MHGNETSTILTIRTLRRFYPSCSFTYFSTLFKSDVSCKQDASTNEKMVDVEIEPLVLCFYETFEMFRTFSDIFDAEFVSRNCVSYIS